uniref:Uncharacterized protein n=1 Tax=Physcomitrium patens TaxID=3218 RepID=A0A2K1LB83_PHYPA|nr:hypothetical protein PHYPA_001720 [Physcomitrium patens]
MHFLACLHALLVVLLLLLLLILLLLLHVLAVVVLSCTQWECVCELGGGGVMRV